MQNFILVNLMTSLILDMYAYRMQRTKEDKVVQLKYLLQDGSTQIWTVIKSLDWRVQVMEGSAELQAMANSDMEKSIQALEVHGIFHASWQALILSYSWNAKPQHKGTVSECLVNFLVLGWTVPDHSRSRLACRVTSLLICFRDSPDH